MIRHAIRAPQIPDHVDRHLSAAGYTLVGSFGSRARIDGRVALRDGTLVFVVVRTRCGRAPRPAKLTVVRQRELRAAAAAWLARNPHAGHRRGRLRFDQVTQTLDGRGGLVALEHLESVF